MSNWKLYVGAAIDTAMKCAVPLLILWMLWYLIRKG